MSKTMTMTLDVGQLAPIRKTLKKGIELNIMVVGERGLGKTTLINTLLESKVIEPTTSRRTELTAQLEIKTYSVELDDKSNKIRLSFVVPIGFGDSYDNTNSVAPVVEFIESQLSKYLHEESGINRRSIIDTRIHCLLYMITPDHRGLKQLDIALMKAVHNMVNIFPILAKADTYTNQELVEMKRRVINDLNANEIKIYEFPECDSDDNPEFVKLNDEMKKLVPFSVVGSLETVPVAGKTVRGRKYPWGFVEIDDPMNSEFPYLKKMLFRTHTHDLRDITSDVHYESYRTKILTSGNHFTVNIIDKDTGSDISPF